MDWSRWLTSSVSERGAGELNLLSLLAVLGLSLGASLLVSALYVHFYGRRNTGSHVYRAFPLLGVSVTAIFVCIQFSLPLSLGLLGALSIVRFRTPIKEPEEIGFIMLVIATSLASATFGAALLAALLLVAVVALLALRHGSALLGRRRDEGLVVVTLPAAEYAARGDQILALLRRELPGGSVDSVADARGEAVVSYAFSDVDGDDVLGLARKLRETSVEARTDVFFGRARGA